MTKENNSRLVKPASWEDLATCNICGSPTLVKIKGSVVCGNCRVSTPIEQGWFNITIGDLPTTDPVIVGQMGEPGDPKSVEFTRQSYFDVVQNAGLDLENIRILELGAGLGRATFGLINVFNPMQIIVSEPFQSLLPQLRANLNYWGFPAPRGFVAAYDANHEVSIKKGKINLIIGNSVLHHIVHYRECLRRCAELLDTPGAAIFAEPTKDAWAFLLTVLRAVHHIGSQKSGNFSLAPGTLDIIKRMYVTAQSRIDKANNLEYLATLEDKHLFSLQQMERLARELGFRFSCSKRDMNICNVYVERLRRSHISQEELQIIKSLLLEIVPNNLNDIYASDLVTIMCFSRN